MISSAQEKMKEVEEQMLMINPNRQSLRKNKH